jgi:hypothetical protein
MDKRQTKQHIEHASVFMRASVLECASVSLVRSRPSAAGTQVRTSCAYVAPPPPPPRAQSCNGSSRNKHRHTATVRIVAPPAPPPRALHFSFLTSLLILNTPFPRVHSCAIVGLVHEGRGSSGEPLPAAQVLYPHRPGRQRRRLAGAPLRALRAGRRACLPACGQILAADNSWDRNPFLHALCVALTTLALGLTVTQSEEERRGDVYSFIQCIL